MRLLRKDRVYEPIKVGDYGDFYYGIKDAVCEDCGARYGEPHKPGCDYERCPRCGHQLVTCKCGEIYEIEDDVPLEKIDALIALAKNTPSIQSNSAW